MRIALLFLCHQFTWKTNVNWDYHQIDEHGVVYCRSKKMVGPWSSQGSWQFKFIFADSQRGINLQPANQEPYLNPTSSMRNNNIPQRSAAINNMHNLKGHPGMRPQSDEHYDIPESPFTSITEHQYVDRMPTATSGPSAARSQNSPHSLDEMPKGYLTSNPSDGLSLEMDSIRSCRSDRQQETYQNTNENYIHMDAAKEMWDPQILKNWWWQKVW